MHDQDRLLGLTSPAEVRTRCAVIHTRKAARAVTQFFDAAFQPSGVRATQFTLLVAAYQSGDRQLKELADQLHMDRTTLTREIKLLEKGGLVAIAIGRDRRARVVSLTPQGEEVLARALPLWAQAQAQVESRLGADRWQVIVGHLNEIVMAVDVQ